MRKFLLIFAALFMTSTALADSYLYIEDFEVKQSDLGTGTVIIVPVKAHFDAMVSAWEVIFNLPEGLTATGCEYGADLSINYFNKNGVEKTETPGLYFSSYDHYICANMTAGYWQDPNGADPNAWVSYGAVKWLAGDYEEMFLLELRPDVNFTGGDITIETYVSSGYDTRGETVSDNGDQGKVFTKVCHVAFEETIEQTTAPDIIGYRSEDGFVVWMSPNEESDIYYRIIKNYSEYGEWTLYTGELLFIETGSYHIEAYAKAEGKSASNVAAIDFTVQGYQKTDPPVINCATTDNAVIVTATGRGHVCLYIEGLLVGNPYSIPRTNVDEVYHVTATAQEEGKLISETTYMEISVPAKEGLSDGISIYVKADQAPYLYSWDSGGSLCGDWPGTRLTEKGTINRVEYYVYHFDKNMVNVIFNDGIGNQTGDFTNITHDAYFIYDGQDLAYGLIPPQVYGNPSGEYAFYVNTDGWSQVYADVNGHTYPMTKIGVDGAGFEVYKWEVPSLNYTPYTITFNDGTGRGVQDASGMIYSREYVKGGYYIYSFYQNYNLVRLDMVTTILYDDSSQRPALEDCSITMISTNDVWNEYNDVKFQVSGTYFSQQARQGSVWYSVDDQEWVEFTLQLNSEEHFEEVITVDFSQPWKSPIHSIRLAAKDVSGAFSDVVTVLEAIDAVMCLHCENLPEAKYTGQPITFNPAIRDQNGRTLIQGEDYTYSFINNVDAGEADLLVQSIYPRYIGGRTFSFTIQPHAISGDVYLAGGENQYYYTGNPIRPEVIVVDETFGTLLINQDYVVSYLDNEEVGTATAIVEGIGNFTGHFELQFEIISMPGDVNYTGTIDITDLQAMVKFIFGEYNKPFNFTAADLNQDYTVNVQDVVGEANLLLTGELVPMTSGSRRLSMASNATQASLYWEDGVLYLNSTVPVAALDIVNSVDGDINWNLGAHGMVVLNASSTQGQHSVIYSLNDVVIPAGLTAIATTTDQRATVVAAMLSDADAELIQVKYNDSTAALTNIHGASEISCEMEGSKLVINSYAALHDIDVTIYSIDGRIMSNKHLAIMNSGQTSIDMNEIIDSNRYLIIVVRNGRQILATQKLTQNK